MTAHAHERQTPEVRADRTLRDAGYVAPEAWADTLVARVIAVVSSYASGSIVAGEPIGRFLRARVKLIAKLEKLVGALPPTRTAPDLPAQREQLIALYKDMDALQAAYVSRTRMINHLEHLLATPALALPEPNVLDHHAALVKILVDLKKGA